MANINQEIIQTTASILQEWGNEATVQMKKLLSQRLVSNRDIALSQSIDWTGTKVSVQGTTAIWNLNDYWIYVDLGVKGVNNRSKTYVSKDYPQGFKYKNLGTPPAMIKSLSDYIARKGIPVTKSKRNPRESNKDANLRLAKRMSYFIKRKGITGTRFYSDVFNEYGFKRLTDKLQNALGAEVEIRILADFK